MKFKTVISLVFAFGAAFLISVVSAQAEGVVRETDIVTFIDGSPIESYNYNGFTYVVAEDLSNYGFDVTWDENSRVLKITREKYRFSPYVGTFVNTKKVDRAMIGTVKFNIYPTDIVTYVNTERADSYNVDGKTIINTDWLGLFGSCTYDDSLRRYDVKIFENEIADCEQRQTTDEDSTYAEYKHIYTQKGVFDGDYLSYGIKTEFFQNKYGEVVTTEYGDFKNDKTIKNTSSYMLNSNEIAYQFSAPVRLCSSGYVGEINQNSVVLCTQNENYKYGFSIRCITSENDNGKEVRFDDNGEFYLIKTMEDKLDDENGEPTFFSGILFDDGYPVYEGKMRRDTFSLFTGNAQYGGHSAEFNVLYATGYTNDKGKIYYYEPQSDYNGRVFYEGNVVNGVAHGVGVMYDLYGSNGCASTVKLYNTEGSSQYQTAQAKPGVIYSGGFFNGLPDGEGTMYDGGFPVSFGTWSGGKKNGLFTEYQSISEDEGYLVYVGNISNDKRDGYGIEYAQKGNASYGGVYKRFDGEWKDNSWYNGKWFEAEYDAATNTHSVYLNYEGEFRYGEMQYGTDYRYYNDNTGAYETKTGWFLDWQFQHE